MVEHLWQTLSPEKSQRSPEHVGSSEQHLVLGRDVVGRHVLVRDLVIVPSQDGRAFIRPAQPLDFLKQIPLLLVCPDSIEEIVPYLDLSPVLSVPLQEQEEKTFGLQDSYPEIYAELKVNLSCTVSNGKCYCGTARKSISETGEWYVMTEGQTVALRRGFALQYVDNQVVLSKVSVTKTQHQPAQQSIAQEILRSQIEEEMYAVTPSEYSLRQGIVVPSPQRDFREITQIGENVLWQRLIYNARLLNPGKEEEVEASLHQSVELWRRNRELIESSDTLVVFERGGIGDAPYQFLAASVLAKQYPEKRLIFVSNSVVTPLFVPQSENMHIAQSIYHAQSVLEQTQEAAVLSLSFANEMSAEETEKTAGYLQSLLKKNTSPTKHLDTPHQIQALGADQVYRLFELQESVLWRKFGKYFGSSDPTLRASLSHLYEDTSEHHRDTVEQYHFNRVSQIEEYAGTMTHLFGCSPAVVQEVLNTLPLRMPEQQTKQRADIVFIYDARSGQWNDEKILVPDQLIQAVTDLEQRFPDKTIGIIIGNTHLDLARFVLHACPKLVAIEGEFEQVLGTCTTAEVVVSVDTSFLHMLNFYKKDAAMRQTDETVSTGVGLPQILGVFGLNAPFPLRRFLPTEAERVIISEREAKDISPSKIVETITALLSEE